MSNWLAVIIVAAIGVLLGGTVTSCFALVNLADIFGVSVDTPLKGEENENN